MVGKTALHYKITEKLPSTSLRTSGEGGMGVVYKAEDTKFKRTAAIKFLPRHLSQSEEEKRRFIHEAKAASALDHNNICTIHEIDEAENGQMFIAMASYGRNPCRKKSRVDRITEDSVVKIVDFGLAKLAGRTMLSKEGTMLGTASYMSPEQTGLSTFSSFSTAIKDSQKARLKQRGRP